MLKSSSATALLKNRGDPIVTRLSSQRPALLIANTTAKSSLGLDDTVHSHDMSQKALKAIFEASTAGKPQDMFLTVCKHKPIQYLGASGGIVPTKHMSSIPRGNRPGITDQDVITKKYENFAVYSDFPKGAGGIEPNELWQDGTYEQMLGQVTKEHDVVPKEIVFRPAINPRQEKFELAGQVGAVPFGDALHRQEIRRYFDAEKEEYELSVLMNKGMTEEQARKSMMGLARERDVKVISSKFGVSEEGARNILKDAEGDFDVYAYMRAVERGENPHVNVIRRGHEDEEADRSRGRSSASALPVEVRRPGAGVTGSGAGDGRLDIYRRGGALDLIDISKRPANAPAPPYRPVTQPRLPAERDTMSPRHISHRYPSLPSPDELEGNLLSFEAPPQYTGGRRQGFPNYRPGSRSIGHAIQ
jgi:NACalpha-BTF3-like transcription factor